MADAGCENGFDLRQLVPAGRCRYGIGIDVSPGMLRSLDDIRRSGRLCLVQADARQLPLADGSVDVSLAMHMLYHVPDIAAAVGELRRITRPGGIVLASTNSAGSMSEIHGLFDTVVSELLGRPVSALPPLKFSAETGAAILGQHFSDVTFRQQDVPLSFPGAGPLVAYLNSVRDPIVSYVGELFSFDAALEEFAARVEQGVHVQGSFRATSHSGVFVCR